MTMIVDTPVPVFTHEHTERLYSTASASRILGLTETALRARVFRDRVRTVSMGRRRYISIDELDRLSGRTP
jgi:hypothetical protein